MTVLAARSSPTAGTMIGEERFLRACRREPVDATPVWFMRQAGSHLPPVRELRERYGVATVARTPELCAQASTAPVEALGVDAAILFADITLPLGAMGAGVTLTAEGPVLDSPIRDRAGLERLRPVDVAEALGFVGEAVGIVRVSLVGRAAVIGIVGAPFTLACYLVEGEASRDFPAARALLHREPVLFAELLERLAEVAASYGALQARAGASAIQVFDSWAGLLGPSDYARVVLPHQRRLFTALRETAPDVPLIHYVNGSAGILAEMAGAGADVVAIDARQSLGEAWRRLGGGAAVQGNLDPARVLAGWRPTRDGARDVLAEAAGRPGHVFNLGGPVLPGTDPAVLRDLVTFVHDATRARTNA